MGMDLTWFGNGNGNERCYMGMGGMGIMTIVAKFPHAWVLCIPATSAPFLLVIWYNWKVLKIFLSLYTHTVDWNSLLLLLYDLTVLLSLGWPTDQASNYAVNCVTQTTHSAFELFWCCVVCNLCTLCMMIIRLSYNLPGAAACGKTVSWITNKWHAGIFMRGDENLIRKFDRNGNFNEMSSVRNWIGKGNFYTGMGGMEIKNQFSHS